MASDQPVLIQYFHPVLFDDRVREHVVRDGLYFALGRLARQAVRKRDLEIFALPHCRDRGMAEAVQCGADRLALRVEDRGLQGDEDACFHEESQLSHGTVRALQRCMIGVFDSGTGGLSVLKALRRRLPHRDFVYVADTARLPYGGRKPAEIHGFACEIADFLCGLEVEGIVVACNTVSATALPHLRASYPVPVWGMVDAGVDTATRATCSGRVAVVGTEATVSSGIFQRKLEARGLRVWARACPALAPAIEEASPDVEVLIRHYLRDMPRVDTLLLACTHFPLRKDLFQKVAGPRVKVVDGADTLAAKIAAEVDDEGGGTVRYYATVATGSAADLVGGEGERKLALSFVRPS